VAENAGFEVRPGELEKAGEQFQEAAKQVTEALSKFAAATSISPAAFGELPASDKMRMRFKAFRDQVDKGTEHLAGQLNAGGSNLKTTARVYRAAEVANTIHQAG